MKPAYRTLSVLIVLSLVTLACATIVSEPTPTNAPAIQVEKATQTEVSPQPTAESSIITTPDIDYSSQQDVLVELYQRANPGVVAIRVLSEEGSGLGSGFIIDKEGHLITNYHVIQSATDLEVDFPSGFKTRGEVIGTDLDSDIAVLKVDAPPEELQPLPLGDSDQIQVGQTVVAIGNPLRNLSTMTMGIISALGRTLESLHEAPGGGVFTSGELIQTDAAINPGNSGGPLLNLNGEVIGVNLAIQSTSLDIFGQPINSGIGFAVSINIVKQVIPDLIAKGEYEYPYLGIRSLDEINLFIKEGLDLSRANGVYITEVTPDSPADIAGLQGGSQPSGIPNTPAGGDLIIAVDEIEVLNFSDFISYILKNKKPGDTITLSVLRDNEQIEIDLTLGSRP
ncbi:MAG: trypsin-like peptidase domain-containing protein [Anaerolineales bacterium]|jgi:2-alkenal reductase